MLKSMFEEMTLVVLKHANRFLEEVRDGKRRGMYLRKVPTPETQNKVPQP